MNKILYLFNPAANNGNAKKEWEKARKLYSALPTDPVDVTGIPHLTKFIDQERPEIVVIAGGDGAVNRVCQAVRLLENKPSIAILPFGYGNAMSYCFGVETLEKAIFVLQHRPQQITIDLMKTNTESPIGVFNIGIGYDARVVHDRQQTRYIGIRSYLLSALKSFVTHPEADITFTIDHDVTLSAKASSLVVANCPVIGRNIVISPDAKLNDGFLDCTLFSTKYAYITNLRLRGFKHPLYSKLGKVHFQAKHIRVQGEPFVQIDGDPMLAREGIEVEILPKQVTFLANTNSALPSNYRPFT